MVGTDAIQTTKMKWSQYVPILFDIEEDVREDSFSALQILDKRLRYRYRCWCQEPAVFL